MNNTRPKAKTKTNPEDDEGGINDKVNLHNTKMFDGDGRHRRTQSAHKKKKKS